MSKDKGLDVIKYNITDAAIAKMKEQYADLTITDHASYDAVRVAIGECRTKRVAVEKKRKELKKDALEYGRRVDSEAKRIVGLLLEIEEPLKDKKQTVDDEKRRIKEEKERMERERVEAIRQKIVMIESSANTQGLSSDQILSLQEWLRNMEITEKEFQEFTDEALNTKGRVVGILSEAHKLKVQEEAEAAERKAEIERLEKLREEQEAEQRRLDKEREAIEAEKKAEQERKDREELERQAQERADKEAKEKLEEEERERKEKEETEAKELARQEALKPDKDKLVAYGEALLAVPAPTLTDKKALEVLATAQHSLLRVVAGTKKAAASL